MAKKEAKKEPELDEHGLVVHTYVSTVLVVISNGQYAETTMRYARSSLHNVHVGTRVVAPTDAEMLRGQLQDELQPDGLLREASMAGYSGVIFVGGPGALELAQDPDAQRLAREAAAQKKLIAAWGHASAILARAGVVKGKRVTGDPSVRVLLTEAGARYTGHQLERDGSMITAYDDAVGLRFGKALVELVRI